MKGPASSEAVCPPGRSARMRLAASVAPGASPTLRPPPDLHSPSLLSSPLPGLPVCLSCCGTFLTVLCPQDRAGDPASIGRDLLSHYTRCNLGMGPAHLAASSECVLLAVTVQTGHSPGR